MRLLLLASGSLLALASHPAFAQDVTNPGAPTQATANPGSNASVSDQPTEQPVGGTIDTIVDDGEAAAPPPAPTGNPVLDRLNALEARVKQLEKRNAELEQQAELNQGRIESVEQRAAKNVQFGWAPVMAEPTGSFTFKPRGVVDADYAAYFERKGGYAYNNGTGFRRARLGVEGTAFKKFNYRLEVDFAGDAVNITDAYLQYVASKNWQITAGQFKAPFGLESNNSDNYNSFLERGMFTNAFGNAAAERRIGAAVAYTSERFNAAVGAFGDNESVLRSSSTSATNAPDESWGVNGRVTWEPILEEGKILHVGVAGYHRAGLSVRQSSGDVANSVRLTVRPNINVNIGNIVDTGIIPNAEHLDYIGGEGAAVFGPVTLAGEYGHLAIDRLGFPNESFDGFYVYGTWFVTGETRPFKNGNFDRIKPFRNFGSGGPGAIELALRYDALNVSNTPIASRARNKADSWTLGLNWYLNPYAKLMFNWVRFNGTNTPLDPVGNKTRGDVVATRLHYDF